MKILLFVFLLTLGHLAQATALPECRAQQNILDFNNKQVLAWRDQAQGKFLSRALIKGVIAGIIENRQGHVHFAVDFDKDLSTTQDRIEVIYNTEFGDLPDYRVGDELIACGDYVTDLYSPLGGVVHWLHSNPRSNSNKNNRHEDGFIVINGVVAGLASSDTKN